MRQELRDANTQLEHLPETDALTGIANGAASTAPVMKSAAQRPPRPQPLALLLVDVDHFKRFNE